MKPRNVPAASGARSIACNCVTMRRVTTVLRPDVSAAANASGKQAQQEARQVRAFLAIQQPVGDEGRKIDLAQLGVDGRGFEEVRLNEIAEFVGDAMLVVPNDGRMRDRQP